MINERLVKENVSIHTSDGFVLSSTVYTSLEPKAVILVLSASATPKEFYRKMAQYLCENGFHVVLFDYRGVASSKPTEGLSGHDIDIPDWIGKDIPTVMDYIDHRFPAQKILLLAHSVGGQLINFIPSINRSSGILAIASSSGYWGHMPWSYRLQTHLFFEMIRPLSHFLWGYSRLKMLGIMEDLPKNVMNTWRRWCSKPSYLFYPPYLQELSANLPFKEVTVPVSLMVATDDPICTPKNVENLWSHIVTAKPVNKTWLEPQHYQLKKIGHFGIFRTSARSTIWPEIRSTLNQFLHEQNTPL